MEYLKIKDNVDLKELEKFGFEDCPPYGWILNDNDRMKAWINPENRRLKIIDPEINLDVLFDLTQSGLVEKVV